MLQQKSRGLNLREVGKSLGWCVYCMPRCVSVKKRVCWVVQRAGSWLMGKGKVPAGSICLRVRHQTFTSAYQLFSALHCQSVSCHSGRRQKWVHGDRDWTTGKGGEKGVGRSLKKVRTWETEGERGHKICERPTK